jgi:hypothetical protein
VLKHVDVLTLNDEEARQLTGEHNLVKAARGVQKLGPKNLVIKRGENGALLFDHDGEIFAAPALPLEEVIDPTGAGDSFAGGFMGYLARPGVEPTGASLRTAMIYGSVMASFCVEGFSYDRLRGLDSASIQHRFEAFSSLTNFDVPRAAARQPARPLAAGRDGGAAGVLRVAGGVRGSAAARVCRAGADPVVLPGVGARGAGRAGAAVGGPIIEAAVFGGVWVRGDREAGRGGLADRRGGGGDAAGAALRGLSGVVVARAGCRGCGRGRSRGGTIVGEIFIALGLWWPVTRRAALVVLVLLHVGIAVTLRISWLFHALMLLHIVLFVRPGSRAAHGSASTRNIARA